MAQRWNNDVIMQAGSTKAKGQSKTAAKPARWIGTASRRSFAQAMPINGPWRKMKPHGPLPVAALTLSPHSNLLITHYPLHPIGALSQPLKAHFTPILTQLF